VLCDLIDSTKWTKEGWDNVGMTILPSYKLGMPTDGFMRELVALNDDRGSSFAEIADVIEGTNI